MIKPFKQAIVRRPCMEMADGITTADLGNPDYGQAMKQHGRYVRVLEECGLQVRVLESDSRFPDSVFIEDVALCTPHCAIITHPGALSRQGEQVEMQSVLSGFYQNIERILSPGTVEAGDVMMVGAHYFIGLSERTNMEGASQLIRILQRFGMTGSLVPLKHVLHLKTGVSYLENNNLLVCGEFIDYPDFARFSKILVSDEEAYAANSLWINGTVLIPEGHPETMAGIMEKGYQVVELDVSEFRKMDGGLSCLSLRF
jgi:dimethylargininase